MPELTWTQRREDDVTLVEAVVENTAPNGETAVVLRSTLSGPVWPPRSQGVPVAGWDGKRYETTVGAGRRVAVGFASPASTSDPPIEIVEHEPVTGDRGQTDADAADVLRALGDPTPPRAAIPSSASTTSLPDEWLPAADELGGER